VWEYLERWYREEAPIVYNRLKTPASEQDIKYLEDKMGLVLPEDLTASLKIHNGGIFHDYEYLSTEQIYRFWLMMNEVKQKGAFDNYSIKQTNRGMIQNTWWHSAWIPFATDSDRNFICTDVSPEKNGHYGQIIYTAFSMLVRYIENKNFALTEANLVLLLYLTRPRNAVKRRKKVL